MTMTKRKPITATSRAKQRKYTVDIWEFTPRGGERSVRSQIPVTAATKKKAIDIVRAAMKARGVKLPGRVLTVSAPRDATGIMFSARTGKMIKGTATPELTE